MNEKNDLPVVKLEGWQWRVTEEHRELFARLCRLREFLVDEPKIPSDELCRIERQESVMSHYEAILRERISHFQ